MTTTGHIISRLGRISVPALPPLGLSFLGRAAGITSSTAIFAVGGWAIGTLASGGDLHLGVLIAVLAALGVARGLLSYVEHYFGHLVAFHALRLLREALFDALIPQTPMGARTRRTGWLLDVTTKDVNRLEVFFAHTLVPVATAIVLPICYAIGFALVNPWFGIITLAGYLAVLALPVFGAGTALRAGQAITDARGDATVITTDTITIFRDILGFQAGGSRLAALEPAQRELGDAVVAKGRFDAARKAATEAIPVIVMLCLVAAGFAIGIGEGPGQIPLPWFLAAIAAAIPSHAPTAEIEESMSEVAISAASARRVTEVLDGAPAIPEPASPAAPPADARLRFRGVTLGHPGGPHVVRGIDIDVPEGSLVAVTGPTGCGKSTIASAAVRLLDPRAGSVDLGGIDLRDLAADEVRDRVVMVPQRDHLFEGTLRDNLLLVAPDAGEADLLRVCRAAALVDESGHWDVPAGLDTVVGGAGEAVSGGQRQRIGFARALLRTATFGVGPGRVLVLDEATSDLDEATQATVTATVADHRRRGGSALVVAHRLATVTGADRILVLADGGIAESGTHDELVARGGRYAAAWAHQGA